MSNLADLFNFKKDPEWIKLEIEGLEDAEFLIAPYENQAQRDAYVELATSPENKGEKPSVLALRALAGTTLLDWKGLQLKGENYEFNKERAEYLLLNSKNFAEAVIRASQKLANEKDPNFDEEVLAENLKKL